MLVDFQGHHDKKTAILLEEISLLHAQLYGRKSKKFKPADGPQSLPDNLPRVECVHDIDDADKICACGCELSRIGE